MRLSRSLDFPYIAARAHSIDWTEAFGKGRFKEFVFDRKGVPKHQDQDGKDAYFPTFVGWYAMACAQRYEASGDRGELARFRAQIGWIENNAKPCTIAGETAAVWTFDFDWKESFAVLKAPWLSGLGQAAIISALVKAHGLDVGRDPLGLARKAAVVYRHGIDKGGVAFVDRGCTYYEEYPAKPYSRVFDGFVLAVIALHDLWKATGESRYRRLFLQGARTIEKRLADWDWHGRWSYYGIHGILCPDDYNKLNSCLLGVMHGITGKAVFRRYSRAWDPARKGLFSRIAVAAAREWLRLRYVGRSLSTGGNF
jgi:hypothetical protein